MDHAGRRMTVRPEGPGDRVAVYRVNELAFGRRDEADLVDRVRGAGKAVVSLVAEEAGRVVGHVLFSPVAITAAGAGLACSAVALAPMAVLPDRQRQGVGSALVRRGLDECRRLGHERIVVLGHPEYYPRFGFLPARHFGVRCEYDAPEGAFMALEPRPGAFRAAGEPRSMRLSSTTPGEAGGFGDVDSVPKEQKAEGSRLTQCGARPASRNVPAALAYTSHAFGLTH